MVIVIVRQRIECNSDSAKIDLRTIDWHLCQYQSTFPVRSDSSFHSFGPRNFSDTHASIPGIIHAQRARRIILINRRRRARLRPRATVVRIPRKMRKRGAKSQIRELSGFGRSVDSRACSISRNVGNGIAP